MLKEASWTRPNGAEPEYKEQIDRLKTAYELGVSIAFGTDAIFDMPGYSRGTVAMMWIDSYIEAGVTSADILKAMTTTAAKLLGVEQERGSIRPGMSADIIATPENPLDNIQTLKQVNFVMKNGKIVKYQQEQFR